MKTLQDLIEKITSLLTSEQLGMYSDEKVLKASLQDEIFSRLPEYMEGTALESFSQAYTASGFSEEKLKTLPFYGTILEKVATDFVFAAVTAEEE